MFRCSFQSLTVAVPAAEAASSATNRCRHGAAAAPVIFVHPPRAFARAASAAVNLATFAGPACFVRIQISSVVFFEIFPANRSVRACRCARHPPAAVPAARTTASPAATSREQAATAAAELVGLVAVGAGVLAVRLGATVPAVEVGLGVGFWLAVGVGSTEPDAPGPPSVGFWLAVIGGATDCDPVRESICPSATSPPTNAAATVNVATAGPRPFLTALLALGISFGTRPQKAHSTLLCNRVVTADGLRLALKLAPARDLRLWSSAVTRCAMAAGEKP
jgi:hypothetical protein